MIAVSHGTFALFLAAAIILAITPGPGIFYVAARTVSGGREEGFASVLGNTIGGLFHVCAGALGVSALVMASASAFAALKLVGAFYLVYLGIKAFRDGTTPLANVVPAGARKALREGIAVEALNPKTAAFFLAFIPQFIDTSGNVAAQFAMLGLISVLLNSTADALVVLAAARGRTALLEKPLLFRRAKQTSGGVLCALGLTLLFAQRSR
jgi:threonine/homoserine/homoserine lactone efflux protein